MAMANQTERQRPQAQAQSQSQSQYQQIPPSSPEQPRFTADELAHLALANNRAANPMVPMAGRPAEEFRDPLAIEAARVTPGVDDTPFIQYALDALTRERDGESTEQSFESTEAEAVPRFVPDEGLGYYIHENPPNPSTAPTVARPVPAPTRDTRRHEEQRALLLPAHDPIPASRTSSVATLVKGRHGMKFPPKEIPTDAWAPGNPDLARGGRDRLNPKLTFKPKILRPTSMIILMILCLLMTIALILCAVLSMSHSGLWTYQGTIYNGQYFLFRVVPAVLAAGILIYAQCMVTTMLRIRPFARLASYDKAERRDALFVDLYPTSFLWPRLVGTWHIWVPVLITWLMNMTLPLQSCLFTVILVDGKWRWATVQGVAWTLVVMYFVLMIAIAIELKFWFKGLTGLIWDVRSVGDVVALVSDSNTLGDYRGTELLGSRDQLRSVLRERRDDRLSYWSWADPNKGEVFWYSLGHHEDWMYSVFDTDELDDRRKSQLQTVVKSGDPWDGILLEGDANVPHVRYRYLPWCLRNNQLLYMIVTGSVLLLALFVVSFLPSTRITNGFLPGLSALPGPGAFSAADFLYSFLPSFLGLILYLLFQSLDLSLRVLRPWAELASPPSGGARPNASILADYAACYPLQSTLHALRNRHWRVAAISFLSTLFILLPVLAGSMFIALTPADLIVRMYPQVPLFAVVLTLLVIYLLALVSMLPGRRYYRLPHGVTCLAEIISFCANDDLVADDAFKNIRNKTSLVGKIGVSRNPTDQPRWVFGTGSGSGRDDRLGIRRVRKFTEPRMEPRMGPMSPGQSRREARRSERVVGPQYAFPPRNVGNMHRIGV